MYPLLKRDRQQTYRRSRFSTTILRDTRSNLIPPLPPPGLSSRRFASRRLLTRLCARACRTCGFCTGTFKLLCKTCVFSKENGRQTIVTSSVCTNADVIKYKRPRKRETAKKMFLKNTIRVKLRVFSRRLYAYQQRVFLAYPSVRRAMFSSSSTTRLTRTRGLTTGKVRTVVFAAINIVSGGPFVLF